MRKIDRPLSANHGQQHFGLADLGGFDPEQVLGNNNEVRDFSGLERTFPLLAMAAIAALRV